MKVNTKITRSALGALLVALASLAVPLKAEEAVPPSERIFRVIEGTESPDKRFALAVGLANERAEKDAPRLLEDEKDYEPDTPGLCNYLVDLHAKKIIAVTGARHFGTRPSYNHFDCQAHWSPDGATVLQLCTAKWDYRDCQLLRLNAGRDDAAVLDAGKVATTTAIAFLKSKGNRAWRKYGEKFALDVREPKVTNNTVTLTILGQIPKSDAPDSSFAVRVKMRITTGDGAELRAKPEAVSYADPDTLQ